MEAATAHSHEQLTVESRIGVYYEAVNTAIGGYTEQEQAAIPGIIQEFGESAGQSREEYLKLLQHGGKRARGMLVMAGYELATGTEMDEDTLSTVAQAALAIEMIQTSLLILDDIQDGDMIRRGMPCVHVVVGENSATNIANIGIQDALGILGHLEGVPPTTRNQMTTRVNDTLRKTGYGQIADTDLKATDSPTLDNIYALMKSKTAYYTILNPLQVGMLLAGSTAQEVMAIEEFAVHVGIAYQSRNDRKLIDNRDRSDIHGNKPTLLMHHALNNGGQEDVEDLTGILGKSEITEDEFDHCLKILEHSGAVDALDKEIEFRNQAAKRSLSTLPEEWPRQRTEFLGQIADFIANSRNN